MPPQHRTAPVLPRVLRQMLLGLRRGGWAALVAALLLVSPATARVVGIVFDDSASMLRLIHLPTFGVQLLAATLDGRPGGDRLFTLRFTDYLAAYDQKSYRGPKGTESLPDLGYEKPGIIDPDKVEAIVGKARKPIIVEQPIADEARQQEVLDRIRDAWTRATASTPYEPVEIMLDRLSREVRKDEKATLVIVTDGAFYDGNREWMPDKNQLRRSYERYKARAQGPIDVVFLFIDHGGREGRTGETYAQMVERQQVRGTLEAVFAGATSSFTVSGFQDLKEGMLKVIATVTGTDRDAVGTVTRVDGDAIEIVDAPFSIDRVIALSIGPGPEAVRRLTRQDFDVADRAHFKAAMNESDKAPGSVKLEADVTQLRLTPALPPGAHRIGFDGLVTKDTFLLFHTDVSLRMLLLDQEGRPADGAPPEIAKDENYRVRVEVVDRLGNATVPVGRLANGKAKLTFRDVRSAREVPLNPSTDGRAFEAALRFDHEGPVQLETQFTLPGFVTERADPLAVKVVDRAAKPALVVTPRHACAPPCPTGTVPFRVTGYDKDEVIADVVLTASPPRPGAAQLTLEGAATGLALRDASGQPLGAGDRVLIAAGTRVALTLVRLSSWRPGSDRGELTVAAVAAAPLVGRAAVGLKLRPELPAPKLVLRRHDKDPTGAAPLSETVPEIYGRASAFDLHLSRSWTEPTADRFRTQVSGSALLKMLVAFDVEAPGKVGDGPDSYMLTLHPVAAMPWYTCACALDLLLRTGLVSGEATVRVLFTPEFGESASVDASFTAEPGASGWETVFWWPFGCFWTVSTTALTAYLVVVCLIMLQAELFPQHAAVFIFDPGTRDARPKHLVNAGSIYLSAFRFRVPRATTREEGLRISVDGDAVAIAVPGESWPAFRLVNRDKYLEEIAQESASRSTHRRGRYARLQWGAQLEEDTALPRKLVFVKDSRRPPQTARTR